jgi:hypothetical protein
MDIGTACPRLKYLKIGNSCNPLDMTLDDMVFLVLGQNAQLLTAASFWHKTWRSEMALHSIQFDEKLLTPICKTLEDLSVYSNCYGGEYSMVCVTSTHYLNTCVTSLTAFLLRHIPRLESLAVQFKLEELVPSTSLAVELLYRQLLEPQVIVQVSEKTNKEDGNGGFVRLNWTVHSPPPSNNKTIQTINAV